jgi:hypothetical protein
MSAKFFLLPLLLSATALFAQTPPLAPLPPDGFVTLQQVVSDFSTQPEAAAQKYNGARILVYGRVGVVEKSDDINGNPLVTYLQLANNPTPDVKCVFDDGDIPSENVSINSDQTQVTVAKRNDEGAIHDKHPFLIVGQNVGIHGTFTRFTAGDVVLHNARKVTGEKLDAALKANGVEK